MSEQTDLHDHDRGLAYDLPRLISRRRALGVLGASFGATVLAACGSSSDTSTSATSDAGAIPEETAGPFPADGSNGPDVLAESGVVRRDITSSFGDSSGSAEGVPARIELGLVEVASGGGPLAGAAVYLWHCDREGRYSVYEPSIADQNYLRGVQVADADGKLSFDSIFPGAYSGRWPHIHFEVYDSLDAATGGSPRRRTSQIAIPEEASDLVYATSGYEQSVTNLAQTSLDSDIVFADGYGTQLASWSGEAKSGIDLRLNVGV